jgi:hypothetical protein
MANLNFNLKFRTETNRELTFEEVDNNFKNLRDNIGAVNNGLVVLESHNHTGVYAPNVYPQPKNWFNDGLLRVRASDGGTELGKYLDFHTTDSTDKDFNVRIDTSAWSDENLDNHNSIQFFGNNVLDAGWSSAPRVSFNLSFGDTEWIHGTKQGKLAGAPWVGGHWYSQLGILESPGFDGENVNGVWRGAANKHVYLYIGNTDEYGQALIRGYRRGGNDSPKRNVPAILIDAARNNAAQSMWNEGTICVVARSWDYSKMTWATPHGGSNFFTVHGHGQGSSFTVRENLCMAPGSTPENINAGIMYGGGYDAEGGRILVTAQWVRRFVHQILNIPL